MGYDIELFLKSDVKDEFICSICQGILEDPVKLSCKHHFCRFCITEWLKKTPSCPVDRRPANQSDQP